MLLFHNYQHVLKFKKLQTAKTVYGMIAGRRLQELVRLTDVMLIG